MIVEEKPQSYQELAEMSGRKPSNLGRTLKTLEQYGIIDIKQSAQEETWGLSMPHTPKTEDQRRKSVGDKGELFTFITDPYAN